jgi:hypothetical protein
MRLPRAVRRVTFPARRGARMVEDSLTAPSDVAEGSGGGTNGVGYQMIHSVVQCRRHCPGKKAGGNYGNRELIVEGDSYRRSQRPAPPPVDGTVPAAS